jgi:hypothetical protein
MGFFVLGEFRGFALNCEEKMFGGIGIGELFGVWAWVCVGVLRRGDHLCVNLCIWGNLLCSLGGFCGLF